MSSNADFKDLVEHICRRPRMYACGGTFYEVAAYIQGYASAMPESPFGDKNRYAFNQYVTLSLGFPAKLAWPYVLKKATSADDEAITRLQIMLTTYLDALADGSVDALLASAKQGRSQTTPAQVACWRLFSRALHRRDQDSIEKLALDNTDLRILWASSYPDDVIPLMDEIAESSEIPVISVSDDGQKSRIMTPDFHEIDLELVSGQWRIDANPIIRQRLHVHSLPQDKANHRSP